MRGQGSFVYFIRPVGRPGPIKIGLASTPKSRLRQHMENSPIPLEIVATAPGDLALERNIQECFVDCHSHAEWFHATPSLIAAVQKIARGVPVWVAIDLTNRKGSIRRAKIAACRARRGTPQETVSI